MKLNLYKWFVLLSLLGVMIFASGCAKLLTNLRRDLDDSDPYYSEPTVGGRWSERGMLSEGDNEAPERYLSVGHSERGPASAQYGYRPEYHDSWVTQEKAAQNYRDMRRWSESGEEEMVGQDAITLSNTPKLDPPVRRAYKNGIRATRADFVDESTNEGSLWASDGQTNYYFTKNKIRGVGDIVSVTIESDLFRDVAQEVRRTLNLRERDWELNAAQERIRARVLGLPDPDAKTSTGKDAVASSAAAPARTPASSADTEPAVKSKDKEEIEIPSATPADIDVTRSLEIKAGDSMMAEIIDRYPNGNYKVRATKRIPYKGGPPRYIVLHAIAKGTDIDENDIINSGKLYEYRIESVR